MKKFVISRKWWKILFSQFLKHVTTRKIKNSLNTFSGRVWPQIRIERRRLRHWTMRRSLESQASFGSAWRLLSSFRYWCSRGGKRRERRALGAFTRAAWCTETCPNPTNDITGKAVQKILARSVNCRKKINPAKYIIHNFIRCVYTTTQTLRSRQTHRMIRSRTDKQEISDFCCIWVIFVVCDFPSVRPNRINSDWPMFRLIEKIMVH